MQMIESRPVIWQTPATSFRADDDVCTVFGPRDHAGLLHARARKGNVILASSRRGKGDWYQSPIALGDEAPIAGCAGKTDTYITYNTFRAKRRTTEALVALCALYADIDHYKRIGNPIADLSPEAVADLILAHLASRNIPLSSIVLDTGRGVALTWLIDPVSAMVRGRWEACQRVLATALAPFGHDRGAIDPTRLTGTINSKSGRTVRILPSSTFERHDFEQLADRLLPYSRAELIDLGAARRLRRSKRSDPPPGTRPWLTVRTLHETRLADLLKLVAGRYRGPAPSARRDEIVFVAAVVLAFLVPPGKLRAAVVAIGKELADWSPCASLACAASVIARAERRVREPGLPDPRYRISTARIVADLAITDDEARRFDLRELRTPAVARERDRLRKDAERRSAGRPTKAERYDGYRRSRQRALDLSGQGMTARKVGEATGLTRDAAKKLIQAAKKDGMTPTIRSPEQRPNIVMPGGESRVPMYDGEPHPLTLELQPTAHGTAAAPTTPKPVQLDLFGPLPSSSPWTEGGIIPVEAKIAVRAAFRMTGSRQAEVAATIGVSRPQLTNIIAGRFGTRPDVAQRLTAWAASVASAA